MEAPIVLTTESRSAAHHLSLFDSSEFRRDLRADRAAITAGTDQLELHPMTVPCGRQGIAVQQRPALLVRDDDVERTTIEEIGDRDRAAVESVRDSCCLSDIDEAVAAAVDQHAGSLVAGEARVPDRRPVFRVLEDVALRAGDLRHRVPIVAARVGRDETVHDDEVHQPIVIQIAELRAPCRSEEHTSELQSRLHLVCRLLLEKKKKKKKKKTTRQTDS